MVRLGYLPYGYGVFCNCACRGGVVRRGYGDVGIFVVGVVDVVPPASLVVLPGLLQLMLYTKSDLTSATRKPASDAQVQSDAHQQQDDLQTNCIFG